jgi:hypothetical protein
MYLLKVGTTISRLKDAQLPHMQIADNSRNNYANANNNRIIRILLITSTTFAFVFSPLYRNHNHLKL